LSPTNNRTKSATKASTRFLKALNIFKLNVMIEITQ
jgi:hypothetical protein